MPARGQTITHPNRDLHEYRIRIAAARVASMGLCPATWGTGNPVRVNGRRYESIQHAAAETGFREDVIRAKCRGENNPSWKFTAERIQT